MRSTTCFCGTTVSADDLDSLVPVALDHFTQQHPDLGIQQHEVRDYLEAEERLTGGTERLDEIGAVEFHEATADRLDDLLAFFDHDAFADNPAWASCYCMCHHVGGGSSPEWRARTASQNRADLAERIRAGTTIGHLAYVDGRVAAWVNASPRSAFPEHAGRDGNPDDEVGSIVCFVVAPPYRRHGLAERLLEEACRGFAQRGLRFAEAYPFREPRDDATAYHGPLSLYLDAGFTEVSEDERGVVVHKELTPSA
jgi:ribosomal protein S18 acetylase RimI-like enzyme